MNARETAWRQRYGNLFEYGWRVRPLRALAATLVRSLAPWWFWPWPALGERSHLIPLLVFGVMVLVLHVLCVVILNAVQSLYGWLCYPPWWWGTYSLRDGMARLLPAALRAGAREAVGLALLGATAWMANALVGFGLIRPGVRPAQVARMTVYTLSAAVTAGLVMRAIFTAIYIIVDDIFRAARLEVMVESALLGMLTCSLVCAWGQYVRCRRRWLAGATVACLAALQIGVLCYLSLLDPENRILATVRSTWPELTAIIERALLGVFG